MATILPRMASMVTTSPGMAPDSSSEIATAPRRHRLA